MSETILCVQGLKHDYPGHTALAQISFALKKGEICGFLGVNGAGKTTCLRLIAGLLPLQAGQIHIAGHDRAGASSAANRQLGFLPDVPPLHDEQRVHSFLSYVGGLHGLRGSALQSAVSRELSRCQLDRVARQLIGTLSKGYRQRLGLAAALLHRPALLLLDEASSGLDPLQQQHFREVLREVAQDAAVLLSSHQLDEVEAVCSRSLILHRGTLQADLSLHAANAPNLLLTLDTIPCDSALLALPGVQGAVRLDGQRVQLQLDRAEPERYAAIAEAVVKQGWGLLAMNPGGSPLAERFFAVSQGRTP